MTNKPTHNPSRSLEMVVSAPVEDCVDAIDTLKKNSWFVQERVFVKTRHINRDLYEFEVKLNINHGKSSTTTPLRGTLRYDENFNTTTVLAEVPSKEAEIQLQTMAAGGIFILISCALLSSDASGFIFLLVMCVLLPFTYVMMVENDKKETQKVIAMTEQVLRLTQSRKSSHIASVDSSESPFYEDDDYQKRYGGAAYLSK